MNPKSISILLSFFLMLTFGQVSFSQPDSKSVQTLPGKYQVLSENGKITIPFEIYRNKIRMTAKINGRDCYLLIDNGSLWDELLFFGSPRVDSLGFAYTKETAIGDTNAPNPVKADIASGISMAFKDIVFTEQTAIVTRYDRSLPNLWAGSDGQVSATFFKHFIVEIDFDESVIRLFPPDRFNYSGPGQEFEMKLGPYNSRTITANLTMLDGAETSMDLLIDLGGLYPLYLPVGKNPQITLPPHALESLLGDGLMKQKGYLGRIKSMRLGKYALKDVLTAFTPVDTEDDIYGNTMIGLSLLQRFNVIFDYFRNRIILEPSRSFSDPFKFNMTGMEFLPDEQGNLKVTRVYPNSPADESKIEVGDIITHINGVQILKYKPGEIKSVLMNEGETVKLDILRKEQTLKIPIQLRQII